MATQRLVNTNFWKDTYVIDLDPVQKLLFLYFLTNPNTTLAGVYEISLRQVAFDTGIDRDMVEKILNKFCMDGKMYYARGWLVLRNFVKHQRLNPSIQKGIEKAVAELPTWLQEVVQEHSAIFDQQALALPGSTQSGTDSHQSEPIEAKLIEAKLIKSKLSQAPAGARVGKIDERSYARAVREDEAQADRAIRAKGRKGSLKSIDEIFGGQ